MSNVHCFTTTYTKDTKSSTLSDIYEAILENDNQKVLRLLETPYLRINEQLNISSNPFRYTLLHHAIDMRSSKAVIKKLLLLGADLSIKDKRGRSCYDLLSCCGNGELVKDIYSIKEEQIVTLQSQLDNREIYWGLKFNVLGENGLNLKLGNGRGSCSDETKQKMSLSSKGKPKSETHKQNLRKPKLSVLRGPKNSSSKLKISKANSKPVLQYGKQDNFIKEWPNQTLAALSLNSTNSPISECCRGVRKTYKGYIWKYKEK